MQIFHRIANTDGYNKLWRKAPIIQMKTLAVVRPGSSDGCVSESTSEP